jgi:Trk K+ transport system NAD-binding subunit
VNVQNPYLNKDYNDAFYDLKKEHNSILMAISKANLGYKLLKNPSKKCRIEIDDYLIVMSDGVAKKGVEKYFKTTDGRFD